VVSRASQPTGHLALDRVLQLLEGRRLSPGELRLLVALVERDRDLPELAESLGRGPSELHRLGERLYARGFLRWRERSPRVPVFGITRAGLAVTRPLLTAAELPRTA
jgi:DNA-binding MarR family transcriptional regulator